MKSPSDSEIKQWRTNAIAVLASLGDRIDAEAVKNREDMHRELQTLWDKWQANLSLKRDGFVTDPTRIDAVTKEILESAKFAGLDVEISVEAHRVKEMDEYPLFHYVSARRLGKMTEGDESRWIRWTERVSESLKTFPFVMPEHFERSKFRSELTDEQRAREDELLGTAEGDSADDDLEIEGENEEHAVASWAVDTWIWRWPGEK
jgi:hypothetical protein